MPHRREEHSAIHLHGQVPGIFPPIRPYLESMSHVVVTPSDHEGFMATTKGELKDDVGRRSEADEQESPAVWHLRPLEGSVANQAGTQEGRPDTSSKPSGRS